MNFLLPALLKALSTGTIVVIAAALAEIFGPFWGALVSSLPIATGPAYVFLSLDHPDSFIATAALNSFVSVSSLIVYLLAYALVAQRLRLLPSLGVALGLWFAAAVAVRSVNWTLALALACNMVVFTAGFILARRVEVDSNAPRRPIVRRWYDLPVRAGSVAGFVLLVVSVADYLGPQATGIASTFPIVMTSLMFILRPRMGAAESVVVALVAMQGMIGLAGFLLTLHLTVLAWGAMPALAAGLGVALAWSGVMMLWRQR